MSAEVLAKVVAGEVDGAVLPIENSLHGSVAEHYDLLLELPVRIERESLLRIRHNVIAMPGVKLAEVRKVMSHPVALSQCRRFLAAHPEFEVVPFYDTAGSVKHLMAAGLRDVAGIAPELAAKEYGAEVLVPGVEDHAENYTRFHLLRRENAASSGGCCGCGQDEPGVRDRAPTGDAGGCAGAAGACWGQSDEDRVAAGAGESVGVRVLCGCAVRYGGEGRDCAGRAARALPDGEGAGAVPGRLRGDVSVVLRGDQFSSGVRSNGEIGDRWNL